MNSTAVQFSPVKDGRRILGEKDTNACLSPAHTKHSYPVVGTPVKRTIATSPRKLLPSPIFAGQKRTRDQLDETEENIEPAKQREASPQPVQTPENQMKGQLYNTSNVMDSHIPTPQNSQPERDETQQTETETEAFDVPRTPEEETRSVPDDSDARKVFIQEKASLLRSRLQSAMRNVADHQFDRRVSDLDAHSRKCPRLSFSVLSTPPLSSRKQFTTFPSSSSQLKTPRIGTSAFISTPFHSTPDLPGRPSPLSSSIVQPRAKKHSQRTPPRHLGSPMQLSSPPATVVRHEQERQTSLGPRAELMNSEISPSQRGDAVDGLLKLMSTAGNQSSDAWTG
ncbi:uncharacterized protein MYU51_008091 [Penicillium brevicompactum]|uniref:uncharacterized protein n=1 Tax=Penicillium brevicompactum TaxID=5074 RepID=UPI00253FEC3E|nr:uncharacterized protein N7506_010052 [Penicillium brevicompactum]KAJ5326950.1 hypothetical protein N7506_010052 [Penicillium brevicompactum]